MIGTRLLPLALGFAFAWIPHGAMAITTSMGQEWSFAPDAWTRGNHADRSYFGWDLLEASGPILGFARTLDDSTPDLGGITTALNPRLYQGTDGLNDPSPTVYGHRSASGNYYSGFGPTDAAHDTVSAVAPASGAGGFTTVVLQVIGQPGSPVDDLQFTMDAEWTQVRNLYGTNGSGAGLYWQEWTAPGANLPFSILMTSSATSRAIDAFQVDTYWSATGPVVNALTAVPEPASVMLAGVAGILTLLEACRRAA